MTIVRPPSCLPRYRYAASAILFALALWGLELRPASAVRRRTSPWIRFGASTAERWPSLVRWVRDACSRRLPFTAAPPPDVWSARQSAARLVNAACASHLGAVTAAVAFIRGGQLG